MPGLLLRRYADYNGGLEALEADLPGAPPGIWPTDHVEIMGDPPERCVLSTDLVGRGIHEGWIVGEGQRLAHRPGGPAEHPWRATHTFVHYEALVVCGVRYRVTHQPDKYADYGEATWPDRVEAFDADDDTPVTDEAYAAGATRVDWFYRLERDDG